MPDQFHYDVGKFKKPAFKQLTRNRTNASRKRHISDEARLRLDIEIARYFANRVRFNGLCPLILN